MGFSCKKIKEALRVFVCKDIVACFSLFLRGYIFHGSVFRLLSFDNHFSIPHIFV
ncbi:hypothetical protein K501DRAFT_303629, partial [Backusella circina FSU 941]